MKAKTLDPSQKKLSVAKTTVRILSAAMLGQVAGGANSLSGSRKC